MGGGAGSTTVNPSSMGSLESSLPKPVAEVDDMVEEKRENNNKRGNEEQDNLAMDAESESNGEESSC